MPATLSPNRLAEIHRYHSLRMTPIVRRVPPQLTRPHLSTSENGATTPSELYAMIAVLAILLFITILILSTLVIKCLELSRTAAANAQRRRRTSSKESTNNQQGSHQKSVYGAIYLL
jgi:hypothetical protein